MSMKRKIEFFQLMRFALARSLSPTRFFLRIAIESISGVVESFPFFQRGRLLMVQRVSFLRVGERHDGQLSGLSTKTEKIVHFTVVSESLTLSPPFVPTTAACILYFFKRPTRWKIEIQ